MLHVDGRYGWHDTDAHGLDNTIATRAIYPDPTDPAAQKRWLPMCPHGMVYDIEIGLCYGRGRYYDPRTGTWLSQDMNGMGLVLTPSLTYNGQNIVPSAYLSVMSQHTDGLGLYTPFQNNPTNRTDPTGQFTYVELLSTTGIQATLGGMVNGIASKLAGKDFWAGFAEGAIGGAVGGSVGYAFQAARAGFFATAVFGRFVEGAVEEGVTSFYNGEDVKDALVNALWGGGMNVATGGLLSGSGGRSVDSIRTLRSVHPGAALRNVDDEFVDLASPRARKHILDGDGPNSGGHRWPGKPGKTPFPRDWDDDKIMHYVSDIATDPSLEWVPQPNWPGRFRIWDTREGVRIRVVVEQPGEGIITAFPD